eukprot:g43567.t1
MGKILVVVIVATGLPPGEHSAVWQQGTDFEDQKLEETSEERESDKTKHPSTTKAVQINKRTKLKVSSNGDDIKYIKQLAS